MDDQKTEGQENQGVDPQAPSNIVINGEEFTPEEAQELVSTGRKTREYEQKWNTSLDKVWPDYGRLTQEKSQWAGEKQKLESQLQQFQTKQEEGTETQLDVQKAHETARKLGIVLKEDQEKEGYVKKADLETYLSERETKSNQVKEILDKADTLEKEIDGSDGRPKFNKKVVLAYAQAYNHADLMKAYEDMHGDQIKSWKETQVKSKIKPGLKTLSPGGKKSPSEKKVSDDNVKDLLKESLWGTE